jgi:hypothetical protein
MHPLPDSPKGDGGTSPLRPLTPSVGFPELSLPSPIHRQVTGGWGENSFGEGEHFQGREGVRASEAERPTSGVLPLGFRRRRGKADEVPSDGGVNRTPVCGAPSSGVRSTPGRTMMCLLAT